MAWDSVAAGLAATCFLLGSPAIGADEVRDRIDEAIRKHLERKRAVGVVVGIIRDGRPEVFGYGRFALDDDRRPGGDTLFKIGSATKTFTAIALAALAREGPVGLGDPVRLLLPEGVAVPRRGDHEITLEHLATHTSGLPRVPAKVLVRGLLSANPYADVTAQDLYDFLGTCTLKDDVGAKYRYSNLGAGLLGHALARRAGVDHETLIVTRVAEPLGMKDTRIILSDDQLERLVRPYRVGEVPAMNWDFAALAGCGALRSSADDLLAFLSANLGLTESPLRPALEACQEPRRETGQDKVWVGLGWHLLRPSAFSEEVVWHNGGTGGYRSYLGFVKQTRTAVVVLCNSDAPLDVIGLEILRWLKPDVQE